MADNNALYWMKRCLLYQEALQRLAKEISENDPQVKSHAQLALDTMNKQNDNATPS